MKFRILARRSGLEVKGVAPAKRHAWHEDAEPDFDLVQPRCSASECRQSENAMGLSSARNSFRLFRDFQHPALAFLLPPASPRRSRKPWLPGLTQPFRLVNVQLIRSANTQVGFRVRRDGSFDVLDKIHFAVRVFLHGSAKRPLPSLHESYRSAFASPTVCTRTPCGLPVPAWYPWFRQYVSRALE